MRGSTISKGSPSSCRGAPSRSSRDRRGPARARWRSIPYAEGQRRYIESLSTYAKQFLERMPKPLVDAIEGISPAVAIEQKNPTTSSRSTVGTATEIYDFLRLLWARTGTQHCVKCGSVVKVDTVQVVVDQLIADCGLVIADSTDGGPDQQSAIRNPQSAIAI